MTTELKNIYRGDEFKFTNYLNSLKQDLINEFLKNNQSWLDPTVPAQFKYTGSQDENAKRYGINNSQTNILNSWNTISAKSMTTQEIHYQYQDLYPTMFKILEFFGDACTNLVYSSIDPGTIIRRHTGDENREAKNIRVHVPLIIPNGDIGMEVWGEEVHWDNVFAFNNQKTHSVWNLTNGRRLILLLDITRDICDLPPAPAWYPGCNDNAPAFPKTSVEGSHWQNSIKKHD